jgi:hypothetical protein
MKRLLGPLALLLAAGCAPYVFPSAEQIDALAKDHASVCLTITSVYGTGRFSRTNMLYGSMSCTNEGLTVKSEAATVGVPITVTPQISIGAPVAVPRVP